MIVGYHPDTDKLYIRIAEGTSAEFEEIALGIVVDFDQGNRLIKREFGFICAFCQSALRSLTPKHKSAEIFA